MSSARSTDRRYGYLKAADELHKNEEQWAAYESTGNYVLLAGPGSGKTKVLTTKVARMLAEDVRAPRGIVCITYSSECARELTRRLHGLGVRRNPRLFVGTVHSFCLKAIVQPFAQLAGEDLSFPLRIATESEKLDALEKSLGRHVGQENPTRWEARVGSYRRTWLDRTAPQWRGEDEKLALVIETYEQLLHEQGIIDFDDMVLIGLRLVERRAWVQQALHARFPIFVVDEYQDLGLPLHRLVMAMCFDAEEPSRLFAVGDTDQSIYGFTGAQPEHLERLAERDGVESGRLRMNYRSRQQIIAASEAALGEARGYEAVSEEVGIIDFHECPDGPDAQAAKICDEIIPDALASKAARDLGQIAVLYYDKSLGNVIAAAASQRGIDFIRIDKNAPYPKTPITRWLEGCAAWCAGGWKTGDPRLSDLIGAWQGFWYGTRTENELRTLKKTLVKFLFETRTEEMSLKTWLEQFNTRCLADLFSAVPTLYDESEYAKKILDSCETGMALAGWTIARFGGQLGGNDQLKLMTLHSSKGLEFDVVCMIGMDQGTLPWNGLTPEQKREPRRLFFVGLTRARHVVHMLYSGWVMIRGSPRVFAPCSEFVAAVKRSLDSQP